MTPALEEFEKTLIKAGRELTTVPDTLPEAVGSSWRSLRDRIGSLGFAAKGVTGAGVVLACAVAAFAVLVVAGGSNSSLVARAYAAIRTDDAVIHFVVTAHHTPNPADSTATADVWISGKRSRAVIKLRRRKAPPQLRFVRHEVAIDGTRETIVRDDKQVVRITNTDNSCAPLLGFCDGGVGDPFATVSDLYRDGKLHVDGTTMFHGRRLNVIKGTESGADRNDKTTIRLLVEPKLAIPVELVEVYPDGHTLTATIDSYHRLPLTPHNKQLLRLRTNIH